MPDIHGNENQYITKNIRIGEQYEEKILALALAICMVGTIFAGCGSKDKGETTEQNTTEQTEDTSKQTDKEENTDEITLQEMFDKELEANNGAFYMYAIASDMDLESFIKMNQGEEEGFIGALVYRYDGKSMCALRDTVEEPTLEYGGYSNTFAEAAQATYEANYKDAGAEEAVTIDMDYAPERVELDFGNDALVFGFAGFKHFENGGHSYMLFNDGVMTILIEDIDDTKDKTVVAEQ